MLFVYKPTNVVIAQPSGLKSVLTLKPMCVIFYSPYVAFNFHGVGVFLRSLRDKAKNLLNV